MKAALTNNDFFSSEKFTHFFDLKPLSIGNAYVTIGNFDGVHLGHQAVINHLIQAAYPKKNPVVVVTFFPSPAAFFHRRTGGFYLTTPDQKEKLLLSLGVDKVITFHFDREFSELSPEAFLYGLKKNIDMDVVAIGRDFALGKNRTGTLPLIQEIGDRLAFRVEPIQPVRYGDIGISSTEIRRRLDEGDVVCVRKMLGRNYSFGGIVTHGADRGSRIGLPTANIEHWPCQKLPAIGVYATLVNLFDKAYFGITNVGFRPTFETQDLPNIETHILDFDGNIYGERMALQFVKKIREEQKFSGVDVFLEQIERDKATARKIFQNV